MCDRSGDTVVVHANGLVNSANNSLARPDRQSAEQNSVERNLRREILSFVVHADNSEVGAHLPPNGLAAHPRWPLSSHN